MSQTKSIIAENPARKVRYLELAKTSDEEFILKEMIPFIEGKGIDISNFRIDIVNFIMSYTLQTYRFIRMLRTEYKVESVITGLEEYYNFYYFFYDLTKFISYQFDSTDAIHDDKKTLIDLVAESNSQALIASTSLSIYLVNLFLNEPNKTLGMIKSEKIKQELRLFYYKLFAENASFAPSEEVMRDILYFCKLKYVEIANMFHIYSDINYVFKNKELWNHGYLSRPNFSSLDLLKHSLIADGLSQFVHYQGMFPLDKKFNSITLNNKESYTNFIRKLKNIELNYYLSEAYKIYKDHLKSYLKQLELPRNNRTETYDASYSVVRRYINITQRLFGEPSIIYFIDDIKYVEDDSAIIPIFTKPFTVEYLQSGKILLNLMESRLENFHSQVALNHEEELRRKVLNDLQIRVRKYSMDEYKRMSTVLQYEIQDLFTVFITNHQGRSFTRNQLDWGERFKTYNDGLFWEFLPEGRSDKERVAMSHCGNMGRVNDVMYSLRSEKKGKYKVHITVTVSSDGYLLETKSYGNNEPSTKYHRHLIDLYITSDLIKCVGNEYDGHRPEVNFTFHKFSPEDKRRVVKHKPLAMINKYKFFNVINDIVNEYNDNLESNPEDFKENEFVFWETEDSEGHGKSEVLFFNHQPILVFNLIQLGNEIEGRMGVFPYQLRELSLITYVDSKEWFIEILNEFVSYFDMNTGSKEIMIPSSFMVNLNDIIATLPKEWEDDIVSSKAIEKIKEKNKHFEEDFIKYKCIEISREFRGNEWSFDDNLNYERLFDSSEDFLIFYREFFVREDTELHNLINNALGESYIEASRYEMQENSIDGNKFWDEFKKIEPVKKMNKDQLSNFYSWFYNFENVLQNDTTLVKGYDYEYYEFYENLDFENPVAVTLNIWMILFNAKETAIESCLEASSIELLKKKVIGYVMNPDNFYDNYYEFSINRYWIFDEVEVEGEKKYKMSFDTQRLIEDYFNNQSDFELQGIALEIYSNWMDEKSPSRRKFENDGYVDHDYFVNEFSYRLLEGVSDEVIEYMKRNKCPITSSSQLENDHAEEDTDND